MGAKAKIPNGTNLLPTRLVGRDGYAIVNDYHQRAKTILGIPTD